MLKPSQTTIKPSLKKENKLEPSSSKIRGRSYTSKETRANPNNSSGSNTSQDIDYNKSGRSTNVTEILGKHAKKQRKSKKKRHKSRSCDKSDVSQLSQSTRQKRKRAKDKKSIANGRNGDARVQSTCGACCGGGTDQKPGKCSVF